MTRFDLRSVARATGGNIVGRQVLAPGPNHSKKDRSLAILPTADGVLVYSHADDGWRECQNHVARQLGLQTTRRQDNRSPTERARIRAEREREARLDAQPEAERVTFALRLFNEARDPYRSPVEAYLRSRKIALPSVGAGEWVRFHPACPFAGQRTPAMICLARDMKTDEPRAIHRTALDPDGNGIEISGHKRLSLGPIGCCLMSCSPD
jgi:hypothetical protein